MREHRAAFAAYPVPQVRQVMGQVMGQVVEQAVGSRCIEEKAVTHVHT